MYSFIHTPTNNLDQSLDFYIKLGFTKLPNTDLTLVSDGKAVIEINPDRFARAGVKLFSKSWQQEVADIEKLTNVIKIKNGYLLSDPSGTRIYLIETKTVPDLELANIGTSVLGNYAGLSLESTSIDLSFKLWQTLGFTNQQGAIDQGWVSLSNADGLGVSLMKPEICPHLFFNPSLTYFNGNKNPEIIAKIRALNIPITEEITHFSKEGIVDNIIIRDPGGYGFFLFND
jgi:hypothetical protein